MHYHNAIYTQGIEKDKKQAMLCKIFAMSLTELAFTRFYDLE